MPAKRYLVSYGASGFLGLFDAEGDAEFSRGDRVCVRGHRGLELGIVLHAATDSLDVIGAPLGVRVGGEPIRRATDMDSQRFSDQERERGVAFEEARRLSSELNLPLEIIDVEVLFEPRSLVVHFLGERGDPRPLVSALARRFDAFVELQEAAFDDLHDRHPEHDTCGQGGCGSGGCSSGSCGSCSAGGCGSCTTTHATSEHAEPDSLVELRHRRAARTTAASLASV